MNHNLKISCHGIIFIQLYHLGKCKLLCFVLLWPKTLRSAWDLLIMVFTAELSILTSTSNVANNTVLLSGQTFNNSEIIKLLVNY